MHPPIVPSTFRYNRGSRFLKLQLALAAIGAALALSTLTTQAVVVVWDGSEEIKDFTNGDNWVGGSAPRNTDYQDDARFNETATAGEVVLNSTRNLRHMYFDTAGWALTGTGKFENISIINSTGLGTNEIAVGLDLKGNQSWSIATGNTLHVSGPNGDLYLRSNRLTISGGGTFVVESQMSGFGGSGTWGVNVGAALMRINTPTLFTSGSSSNAAVFITDEASILQVEATLGQVEAMMSPTGRIRDTLGMGLMAVDLGNGYIQVTPVPEPSSALMLLAGSLLVLVRRGRPGMTRH